MKEEMTQEYLKSILRYNPSTGLFKWRERKNGRRLNKIAGYRSKMGYIKIGHKKLNGKKIIYQAHRLAWLYMCGYFPENLVDHINRKPWDNRWDNLRHVSPSCNAQNCSMSKRNTSGVTGVYKTSDGYGWMVYISVKSKLTYIGYFVNFNDAVKARWLAEKKYKYNGCNSTSNSYRYLKDKNLI